MRKFFRIYSVSMANNIKSRLSYRVDFILSMILMVIGEMLLPLFTLLIYQTGASFADWNFYEAMLIQSVFMMSTGVSYAFFFNIIFATMHSVREGSFDIILLKPVSPIVNGIATSFEIDNVGAILGGISFFIYSIVHLPNIEIMQWLQFIALFLMGLSVILSLSLFMAGMLFKWVGNSRIHDMFTSVVTFGRYPISIFPKAVMIGVSYILPIAMIGFFPASALLEKIGFEAVISSGVCVIFLVLAVMFWNRMIRSYSSAGG